jgi:predicted enzyme related to lactoylglutathione lyase
MTPADTDRARTFYEAVLGLPFTPGRTPGTWVNEDIQPPLSMWSPEGAAAGTRLTFRVDDVEAAAERVRTAGGTAADVEHRPYGLVIECVDDQGTHFWLWQPAG